MGDAPTEPSPGSSQQVWNTYYSDFNHWYYSCLTRLNPIIYPPNLPPPDDYADNKGWVWTRVVSSKAVEFRLNYLHTNKKPKKIPRNSSNFFYIIGIKISSKGNYDIITYSNDGISTQSLNRKKCMLKNLFFLITNHIKCPKDDLNKIQKSFWNRLK